MSITIEEITADVGGERPRESRRDEGREAEPGGQALAERIRAVMQREKRRLERLSDQ
jgi:hypothetical protein